MSLSAAIVGLGRIGLPLALSFADRGVDVIGVDKDGSRLETVAAGRMPFEEPGTHELLERVLPSGRLKLTDTIADAAQADYIVLTLGTPAHVHLEIDISQIRSVVDDLLPLLREGQTLILRSTVAPSTTDWLAGYVEQRRGFSVGEDFFIAHVPERIANNRFLEEIETLPTIIGGVGAGSGAKAAELFEVFGAEIRQTSPVEAELAKISSAPGMLLAVSRVHESMPRFIVDGLKRRLGSLRDRKVAVLGLTFKRDSDDRRDSLSDKLIRLLERELAHVARHDPHVPDESEPLDTALAGADAVVIATNHSAFDGLLPELPTTTLLVDPWNITGAGRVFGYAEDLVRT
jgi:UDP-N-acetyl-D-mannosaminuronate dehydrogenase